ncbi:MAG: DUF4738 domain-containing protein [Prevotella sp.]|nr:DUF4738 domain-containing protein [Prevotella sp.]
MRKNELKLLLMAITVMGMSSCKEKKQSEDIITTKPKVEVKKPTQKVGDYETTTPTEWVGSTYQVYVQRQADPSLPLADDGQGNKYYDNKITVKITRKDGSVFFSRTFTKSDFDAYVDPLYKKNSALLGIVLDKAEGDNLAFAASVGSPDKMSDEYVPLVLKISRFGDVKISKDTQLDTGAVEDETGGGKKPANNEIDEEEDGV